MDSPQGRLFRTRRVSPGRDIEGGPLGVFWFGLPRYIIREILVQQIRILKGLLSFDREKLFGARWRFNYLLGQAIEARIMRAETADLSLSQTTIR
jgi:hypothetical protein